jgi:hypothetical protein
VLDKHVPLFKRASVQKHFQTLTRRQFAFFVLRRNALFTTAKSGKFTFRFELFEYVLQGFSLF